jgi:HEPN domain-containing protein
MREQVIWYLATANEDDHAIQILVKKGQYARAVFHCQQMAEKAFKALIAKRGRVPPNHDLLGLMHFLEKCDHFEIPERIKERARKLDHINVRFRHPGEETTKPENSFAREIVEELHDSARTIMSFAEGDLREEIALASEWSPPG